MKVQKSMDLENNLCQLNKKSNDGIKYEGKKCGRATQESNSDMC